MRCTTYDIWGIVYPPVAITQVVLKKFPRLAGLKYIMKVVVPGVMSLVLLFNKLFYLFGNKNH